ncbi:hypothetical protein K7X08_013913 [Anisodus acutangulus]|uniref:Calmodulin-binding domain-containing protein n=1 Tax=Anisodus acutangulus TaxID=402998 RepID=A0A9Q1LL39_9SOLA|nr:hypothetical protein K7X08_013913 [Anisodus acutangulus]
MTNLLLLFCSKIQVQNLVKPKNIMPTRAKDTAPPGKEKRGISTSHPIPHHLRSPNSSTTNSPVRKRADSTISNKNVPNYLKPTMSSSGDSNIHNKPTLTRRRSFDKPPVATSPKNANPKERILRSSSSFSSKTSSTSQKPLSDRLYRTPHMTKDATGKQRGIGTYARPGTMKKITTTGTAELSEQEDNQELPLTDTESDVIINNSETAATDTEENNSAIEDREELSENVNNAEIENLKVTESSIVEENLEIIKKEKPEEAQLVEGTSTSNPKEPEEMTNELNEHHLEENTVKVVNENQQKKEEEEGRNQEKEAVMAEEGESVKETNTTVATSKPQRQVVQGKNESVISNDVIEETASKLREQRKNRVRALAGAFETVISLQEPKV